MLPFLWLIYAALGLVAAAIPISILGSTKGGKVDLAKDFHIGFLGPSRIGKTTIVAAMVEEFKRFAEEYSKHYAAKLSLTFGDKITGQKLTARINELKGSIVAGEFKEGSLAGTGEYETFALTLECSQSPCFKQTYVLHDFLGEWVNNPEKKQALEFKSWDVLIVPIDATLLMEARTPKQKGWARNQLAVEQVCDMVRDWSGSRENAGLCILTPIKCETYFSKPKLNKRLTDKSQLLLDKVQDTYGEIISLLQKRKTKNIRLMYMPINTIGCCYLDHCSWNDDGVFEGFYRISKRKGMDKWVPYGPLCVQLEICRFFEYFYSKVPSKDKTPHVSLFEDTISKTNDILRKCYYDFYQKRVVTLQDIKD